MELNNTRWVNTALCTNTCIYGSPNENSAVDRSNKDGGGRGERDKGFIWSVIA